MRKQVLIISIFLLFFSCKKETGRDLNKAAKYKVTFNLNWNSTDFPTSYPSNAHFSKLIGWNHNGLASLFSPGEIATEGIKKMAESGLTTPLNNEINLRIENGEGEKLYVGDGLTSGVGTITLDVEVSNKNSLVSIFSMLAPSPDWYIGVVNLQLLNEGVFVENKTIDLFVFDAGTDDGTTFLSSNSVTNPQEPITLLVDTPLGNGVAIISVIGTATFEKQ